MAVTFRPALSTDRLVGPLFVATNRSDDELIRELYHQVAAIAHSPLAAPRSAAEDASMIHESYSYTPVSLWHRSTVDAMGEPRRDTARTILDACKRAGVIGFATVGLVERSYAFMARRGISAYSRETDAEVTVTVRLPDGKSSGWAGQAFRDWNRFNVNDIVQKAIELAKRGANAQAAEPGRRTAILSAEAVAQLVRLMAGSFDAGMIDMGGSPLSRGSEGGNTLKTRVMDERINMSSDPRDPEGGFPPFFQDVGLSSYPGLPIPAMSWIEKGVLKNMAYGVEYALLKGKPWSSAPYSVRLDGGSGTVEDMIAACDEGIYVNRFSGVDIIDPQTCMLTGVTRDGCFLVKGGKIDRPVKNFRFTESPFHIFNRVMMIGDSRRAAFGHTPPSAAERAQMRYWPPEARIAQWPHLPVIVPPMMVRDFNFTGLSDAV